MFGSSRCFRLVIYKYGMAKRDLDTHLRHRLEGLLYYIIFHYFIQSQAWQAISGHVFSCGNARSLTPATQWKKRCCIKSTRNPYIQPPLLSSSPQIALIQRPPSISRRAPPNLLCAARIFVITMRIMWSSMHNFSAAKWLNVFLDTSNRKPYIRESALADGAV
jgi:hypothetical protein